MYNSVAGGSSSGSINQGK